MARKDRPPVIFCLSQIHSGTWSALAWLVRHEDVPGLLLSTGVYEVLAGKKSTVVMGSEIYTEKLEPGSVYHEHIRPDYRHTASMDRSQLLLAAMNPTLIPVRDPLASLVSYHHRAEISGQMDGPMYLPIDHVCMRWVLLATEQALDRAQISFLPWDLHGGPTSAELWWTSQALGLKDRAPSRGKYPHQNQSGDYALKEAYRAKDASFIEGVIDDAGQGKAYTFLRNREPQLRPFLESIGYRNLIWWS